MSARPCVVVLAYERPEALGRLLTSLDRAAYPDHDVTLLISFDKSGSEAGSKALSLAKGFEWRFGEKLVVQQPQHLGVVEHFLAAGCYTRTYDEVILLEDDLTVSPAYYDSACQILDAYGGDDRIAGCCLYGLWFNGFTQEPFLPLEDGGDVFFLRVPYTQGLCFSARQWQAYERFLETDRVAASPDMHPSFLDFGPQEWFPSFAAYLAQTGRFFCFPRASLTVGWGDAGTHFSEATSWFQTPLLMRPRRLNLPSLEESLAVYDGFFELLPDRLMRLAGSLPADAFDLDLNATKLPVNLRSDHVATTRPVRRALRRFGLTMSPPELNLVMDVPGKAISLALRTDVYWDSWSRTEAQRLMHTYYWRRHRPSSKRWLRFATGRLIARLRSWRSA